MPSGNTVLCVNCMKPIDLSVRAGEVCPHCGYNNQKPQIEGALPYRTTLKSRYILGRVRAKNSEGFTYTAYDASTGKRVDIREFYPTEICTRSLKRIIPYDGYSDLFNSLKNEFAEVARGLAKIRSAASVIRLIDAFKDNNTSYLVYEHRPSETLRSYVKRNGPLTWNQAKELFIPMMTSLSAMHSSGLMHLGISPDTLRVCTDGKMRLSDFCIPSVRQTGTDLTPDLVNGCAAYEQYSQVLDCAETTDVYGFAASLLFALSGTLPKGAVERNKDPKLLIAKDVLHSLPENVIKAIAAALQVKQENRTGSFDRFRAELTESTRQLSGMSETSAIRDLPGSYDYTPQKRRGLPTKFWLIFSFIFSATIFALAGYWLINEYNIGDRVTSYVNQMEEENDNAAVETVTVPDMVGDSYNDWVKEIADSEAYEFTLNITSEEFSDEYDEGIIIHQSPSSTERVEKDGTVDIVVSKGSTQRSLPDIRGISFTEALSTLENMGFVVEKTETYSSSVRTGVCICYGGEYNTGDVLEYGSTVPVLVSLGKDPTATASPEPTTSPTV